MSDGLPTACRLRCRTPEATAGCHPDRNRPRARLRGVQRVGVVGLLGLGLAVAVAPAQAAPLAVPGWPRISSSIEGSTLLWTTTVTNRLRGFDYWAAEVSRVPLGTNGPRGVPETPVVVRTQAGPLGPVALAPGAGGTFTLLARGRNFAPPVIWCCDDEGVEVVMESDGRATAPRALAAGADGTRVRMLLSTPAAVRLVSASALPGETALPRTEVDFPGRPIEPLAAIAGLQVAWVDETAPNEVRTGVLGDTGVTVGATLPQPGPVAALWVTPSGTVVVAGRVGAGFQIARHDTSAGGARRVVFRGSKVPPLSVGGGVVAVADGRRVLAGRGSLTEVRRTKGVVASVATDGRRLAIFERLQAKGGVKRTAVRLVRVPR